jgi:hypothetical protein
MVNTPEAMNPGDDAPPCTEGTGEVPCAACEGTGRQGDSECRECGGTGLVNKAVGGA